MESLKIRYQDFNNSYKALGLMIATRHELHGIASHNPLANNLFSSGIVKHFEMTYETAWKFLKQYLVDVKDIRAASPKEVFRMCFEHQVLPESIGKELLMLVDIRNETTHMYSQKIA